LAGPKDVVVQPAKPKSLGLIIGIDADDREPVLLAQSLIDPEFGLEELLVNGIVGEPEPNPDLIEPV
jgi:hypothetical protein